MQILFEMILTDLKWTTHGSQNRSTENFRASTVSDKKSYSELPKVPAAHQVVSFM